MSKTLEQKPLIDTTTDNLIIDLSKTQMQIKAEGSQLRRLQKSVGNAKNLRDGIIDELTKRSVELHKLELPFGFTMETLFAKGDPESESDEEGDAE